MDKALAYHASGPGLNPDTTKGLSCPILLGTPPRHGLSLSLSLSHYACRQVLKYYLSLGR